MGHPYLELLHRELLPASGCTEPIAISYASAVAAQALGNIPQHLDVACSGNIIKNVKGVVIPHSSGRRGVRVAAMLGAIGGDAHAGLEVLHGITDEHRSICRRMLESGVCTQSRLDTDEPVHIIVTARYKSDMVLAEVKGKHDHISRLERNGTILLNSEAPQSENNSCQTTMSIQNILHFADSVDTSLLAPLLDRQIDCNMAIAERGLTESYGAEVGRTLLERYGGDICLLARAYAAAGSDARMSGCDLPVVINSGSGNQGMAASLPVIIYARETGVERQRLYRALAVSNLIALHQKQGIGRLSAYCGAVSAACGSGAALTYLCGGTYEQICLTITNTLGNVSGIVCDGAKPSCAAKVASAVDAAFLGHSMAMTRRGFGAGEGIIKNDIEATINAVSRLARVGMRRTDDEILELMMAE